VIEDGISCLQNDWYDMLKQLYTDCFGPGYIEKNPQYEPDEPAPADTKVVKLPPKNAPKPFKP